MIACPREGVRSERHLLSLRRHGLRWRNEGNSRARRRRRPGIVNRTSSAPAIGRRARCVTVAVRTAGFVDQVASRRRGQRRRSRRPRASRARMNRWLIHPLNHVPFIKRCESGGVGRIEITKARPAGKSARRARRRGAARPPASRRGTAAHLGEWASTEVLMPAGSLSNGPVLKPIPKSQRGKLRSPIDAIN